MSRSTNCRSFEDSPPGNHLHWYEQQEVTAKSIKPTKNPKYNNILPAYTCT